MMTCAVSVAETAWDLWLGAVSNMKIVRDVELPAALLVAEPGPLALCQHHGLSVSHVRDLLPPDLARYLSESPVRGRDDVLAALKEILLKCRSAGTHCVSLEMGLDRMGEDTFEDDSAVRVKLLRGLIPIADRQRLTVCVQARYPRSFPTSKEWERAGSLIHDVMHPRCRLTVNTVPNELPRGFDVKDFVRSCCFRMGVVRFLYDPGLGANLVPESQAEWAAALRHHGFRGVVVFCPRVSEPEAVDEACARIDECATFYVPV